MIYSKISSLGATGRSVGLSSVPNDLTEIKTNYGYFLTTPALFDQLIHHWQIPYYLVNIMLEDRILTVLNTLCLNLTNN